MRFSRSDAISGSASFDSSANARASRSSGAVPGRISIQRQLRPPAPFVSSCNRGCSPARTSEDLPLPELPTDTFLKGTGRWPRDYASICELLLAAELLPIFELARLGPHPDLGRLRPA